MSMKTIVTSIIKELKLNDDDITNIYNFGSWVYGTNHEKSDRDFLFVMKVTDKKQQKRLKFKKDFDYFHKFQLHRLSNYDITIHSCENFEILLEKNYMLAVECLFYPEEFILRNEIDYKTIYLSKYYNPFRLKQVVFYENRDSWKYIFENEEKEEDLQSKFPAQPTIDQFLCDAVHTTTISEDRLLKYLFHGVRYLDIGEQLIQTKSIYDFKRSSYILSEMKNIYINNNKNMDFPIDYIRMKGEEYKTIINKLVPTNNIDGNFKVHITVNNDWIDKFLSICQPNGVKVNFIHLENGYYREQLMTSCTYNGSYPNIVEEMETLINEKYQDCCPIRLKIKSFISNAAVPDNDIEKLLFWDKKSNYFEFHYKVLIQSERKLNSLRYLCQLRNIFLATNAFKKASDDQSYCIVTMRLFHVGRIKACCENDSVIQYLTGHDFPPVQVESHFVVYDSNIGLDNGWSYHNIPQLSTTSTTVTNVRPKYRIGGKNRKVNDRSSD